MNKNPYEITIDVITGDPRGAIVIRKKHWTGEAIALTRDDIQNPDLKEQRERFKQIGVYILIGHDDESGLNRIYIGRSDNKDWGVIGRITDHLDKKDWWDRAIGFVATDFDSGQVIWLEHALCEVARKTDRCKLENLTKPAEPKISSTHRAQMKIFLEQMISFLPLINVLAFEEKQRTETNKELIRKEKIKSTDKVISLKSKIKDKKDTLVADNSKNDFDTIIISSNDAKEDTETFLKTKKAWWAVRIHQSKLTQIQYIAIYITAPTYAITHWAKVKDIEEYGEDGKYRLNFDGDVQIFENPIENIEKGKKGRHVQGSRYTTMEKLRKAKNTHEAW